jgi:hypothetical protein
MPTSKAGFGWLVVGIVLLMSGVQHVATRQILGRVYIAGATPVLEGKAVVALGILEMIAGAVLAWRWFRSR